jgi:hypothetical protein
LEAEGGASFAHGIAKIMNANAKSGSWVAPLLVIVLLLGAMFRLVGVNWDDYTHLHPDERFLTMAVSTIRFPWELDERQPPPGCPGWDGYFNTACAPLNSYNYPEFPLLVYGTFPLFLTRFVGMVVHQADYDQIHLVGRVLSALFDLSTVLLIFLIGRRIYGMRAGLLGAFFLAASVLDIQQSHFFTVDTFTNVPILVAFWYALDIAENKGWTAFLAAGIAFGLALAGRINIAPFAGVLFAAAGLRAYRQALDSQRSFAEGPEPLPASPAESVEADGDKAKTRRLGPLSVSVAWRCQATAIRPAIESFEETITQAGTRAFVGLAVVGLLTIFVFRIFQPYAAHGPSLISPHIPKLDFSRGAINFAFDVVLSWAGGVNPKFADDMAYASDLVAGKIDYPPGHQWTDRPAYLFPFENMVQWGLGLPLGLAGWAGFLFALYQLVRYRRWEHLLIILWVGITFGYTGQQFAKTMRYFLQIYPFFCLLAGWCIVELWDRVAPTIGNAAGAAPSHRLAVVGLRSTVGLLAIAVIGYTLFYATAFLSIYTHPYTRVAASEWMYAHIPSGAVIANEQWDDPVPVSLYGLSPFPAQPGGTDAVYRNLSSSDDGEMHWYAEDTPEKRLQAILWLDEADYIALSSNRLYCSIPRLPMRYPLTARYYQWLFDGTLGFENIATFTSRPQLFGIQIKDDDAEEAFTVYDHPQVLIFQKTPQYSHDKTAQLFQSIDLSQVRRLTPLDATKEKSGLVLPFQPWYVERCGDLWTEIAYALTLQQ